MTKNPYKIDDYDVLFAKCDNTFTNFVDSSLVSPKVITPNWNATQLNPKFNKSAGFFNGTTDYLIIPYHADFEFFTDDYDVEFFVNLRAFQTFTFYDRDSRKFSLQYNVAGQLIVYQAGTARITASWVPELNKWYHIRVQRDSGVTSLYVGTETADIATLGTYTGTDSIVSTGWPLYICAKSSGAEFAPVWLKELRISRITRPIIVPTREYTLWEP